MENNPIGFRPNDIDKITYLAHKVIGQSLPSEDYVHIPTVDVYGNREPWELFDNEVKTHFFSNLKIKNHRKRGVRSVGAGAWKICPEHKRDILDLRHELVGHMNSFEYRNPSEAHQDRRWILDEYTLASRVKGSVKSSYKGFRFCTLFKVVVDDNVSNFWFEDMRRQSIIDAVRVKCSRKRKAAGNISPDGDGDLDPDVC